jgi:hypothetical protein
VRIPDESQANRRSRRSNRIGTVLGVGIFAGAVAAVVSYFG